MLKRIIFDVILFLSIVAFAPWWVVVIFAIALTFYFPNYYEIIVAGVLLDAIYGTPQTLFFDSALFFSLGFLIIFLLVNILKKRIIYYN